MHPGILSSLDYLVSLEILCRQQVLGILDVPGHLDILFALEPLEHLDLQYLLNPANLELPVFPVSPGTPKAQVDLD